MAETRNIPGVDDELEVTIGSMAFGGDGVARHDDYVLFVPDVIPGEQVRVKVTAAKRSYGRALPLEILRPSPDRIEPRCGLYGLCGGCQYQHISYVKSAEFKERQIKEVIQRIGALSVDDICEPIVPSPEAYNYRNSISLRLRKAGKGWEAGYIARDNRTFVPVSDCPIAVEPINEAIADIESRISGYGDREKIEDVTIRYDGDRAFVYPRYHKSLQLQPTERLFYIYKSQTFCYGARSFFQINHSLIPALIDLVTGGLDPKPSETLLDLYAGVGLFSIALAKDYARVTGVELGQDAVKCFEDNIRENSIQNVAVVRGAVEDVIQAGFREHGDKPLSVLVDPPREGMKADVVRALTEGPARKLVYVSCDPSTLARDLKLLSASFSLKKVTPLDMFPQTKHLEAVAVLEKSGS